MVILYFERSDTLYRSKHSHNNAHLYFRIIQIRIIRASRASTSPCLPHFCLGNQKITLRNLLLRTLYPLRGIDEYAFSFGTPRMKLGNRGDSQNVELTASSASIAGSRSSTALTSAMWLSSGLVRRSPAFVSGGATFFSPSNQAVYSSSVEQTHWKVDVTFHGFVETYTRGDSRRNERDGEPQT